MHDPNGLIELVYRTDGTWDFESAHGVENTLVIGVLRGIADQIEAGATITNPS